MIKNTADDQAEHLAAVFGGIEAQEARGQRQLAADSALPTGGLESLPLEWGIQIGAVRDGDPLFTAVTLPTGWQIKSSDHSMWSYLHDADGQKRAAIFYKAAFYDRRAFIQPEAHS